MKTLTIELPDMVDLSEFEAKMILASKLYERGVLTMRQAAKFAGLSYREFMESLGSYGVSFMNYPAEEIARDVKNA